VNPRFVSAALTDQHVTQGFGCGKEALDTWLTTQAARAQAARTARTFVWTWPDDPRVVAYYSIAPTQVHRQSLPAVKLAGGYSVVPGYLLARLALDSGLHGQGLGSQLLIDALERIVVAAGSAGGRLIVVDAIDDAAQTFYRHHDFVAVPGIERLYLKVATAELALRH
jgi:GNAT superfamily N-acetyltransferase